MEIDQLLLEQIAASVLRDMLGFETLPTSRAVVSPGLTASIHIFGDWDAVLEVQTDDAGARRIAEQMFGTPASDLTHEEISDALGEIVNMVGGNIKGLCQAETRLSLPCVGPSVSDVAPLPWTVQSVSLGEEVLTMRFRENSPVRQTAAV